MGGDVSATPAVVDGAAYFPDWGGNLNKIDTATGNKIWSYPISNYDGIPGSVSRTSPAVVGGKVYIGDQNGGHLSAINASTGKLIWTTQLDPHPAAILTGGPLVHNRVVYQGVASLEEAFAANGSYPCCTFRGSIVAVNASTGEILWKTYMVPSNGGVACTSQNPASGCGYSGAAIWATTPALDPATNTLFVTTGNNTPCPTASRRARPTGARLSSA